MLDALSRVRLSFALATALLLPGAPLRAADHCVVLQYHHVDESTPAVTSISPALFQQQLDYLRDHAHRVMPLADVIDALNAGEELPERCVALTIDDAYASAYTEAFPRVFRSGYPLTVFVSSDAVDRGLPGYLSWEQIREMHANGVRFENHSRTHAHLVRRLPGETEPAWTQRVGEDIRDAQARIEHETGRRPTLFAYPYGEYDHALKTLVLSMGLTGFGQQSGPLWRTADPGALPRFPMSGAHAAMHRFADKVRSLPLPITAARPEEPVVPLDTWRPSLTLIFRADADSPRRLSCYFNGSAEVDYAWAAEPDQTVVVTPRQRLAIGRNRTNCTLPIGSEGRFGWYSHNWIRRREDGGWYAE